MVTGNIERAGNVGLWFRPTSLVIDDYAKIVGGWNDLSKRGPQFIDGIER